MLAVETNLDYLPTVNILNVLLTDDVKLLMGKKSKYIYTLTYVKKYSYPCDVMGREAFLYLIVFHLFVN